MEEYLGKDDISIDDVLEDGKIKFKVWRKLGNKQRALVLDSIFDEMYTFEILSDIAPELRIGADFPDNYRDIQSMYMSQNGLYPRTRESIDNLRNALHIEMESMRKQQINLVSELVNRINIGQASSSNPRNPHAWTYGGHNLDPNPDEFDPYDLVYECEDYRVFEMYNFKDMVRRFAIEPRDASPLGYYNALHDIYDNEVFAEMFTGNVTNIVFETNNLEEENRYTFSSKMGIDHVFEELYNVFIDEHEVETGIYKHIREFTTCVYINLIQSPRGGSDNGNNSVSSLKDIFKLVKPTYKGNCVDSCFFQCLSKILSSGGKQQRGTRFPRMRQSFVEKGVEFPNDVYTMPLDKVHLTREVYGINVLVFVKSIPEVVFYDESIKYDRFEDIRRRYTIKWKCYNDEGFIYSDSIQCYSANGSTSAGYIVIDDIRYYMLLYDEDSKHFSCIYQLDKPRFCERCGSFDHNIEQSNKIHGVKLQCLSNLSDFIDVENLKIDIPEYVLVFFDFETFVKNGEQCPHAVSFQVLTSNFEVLEKGHIRDYKCSNKFVVHISSRYKQLKYFIGYNISRFDCYFLINSFIKILKCEFSSDNSIIYRNRMLRLSNRNIVTWDLYEFVKASLGDACIAYGVGTKMNMDHKALSKLFLEKRYSDDIFNSEEYRSFNVEQYCNHDVELTVQLFRVVYQELCYLTGINILLKPTLSSLVYSSAKLRIKKLPAAMNNIYKTLLGARVQVLEKGYYADQSYSLIDINACYTSIGIEYQFGTGNVYRTDRYEGDRLYMCFCDVDQSSLKYKLIGQKNGKNRSNDWTSNKIKDVWLYSEEVEALEEYGCSIIKKAYIVWEEKEYVLRDVMTKYRDQRLAAKQEENVIKEKQAKLLGNGLAGKLLQKNNESIWRITNNSSKVEKFKDKYKDSTEFELLEGGYFYIKGSEEESETISKPIHIGYKIIAMGRLKLWRYMNLFDRVLYCDTDGMIVPTCELHKVKLDDQKYGHMKLVTQSSNVYIVGLKAYWMNERYSSLRGYRDGEIWNVIKLNHKEEMPADDPLVQFLGRKISLPVPNKLIHTGTQKDPLIYRYMLDPEYQTSTTYDRITKKFVKSGNKNGYKLATLDTKETSVILK